MAKLKKHYWTEFKKSTRLNRKMDSHQIDGMNSLWNIINRDGDTERQGHDARVTTMIVKHTVITEVVRTRTEMVETLWWQQAEAKHVLETPHQDHLLLTNILTRIDEQGRKMMRWRRGRSQFPTSVAVVTPSASAGGVWKNSKPPPQPIETENSYHFFWANQKKVVSKFFSWTQFEFCAN